MHKYKDNHIEVDKGNCDFDYEIRTVIQYKNKYVVLLSIPFNSNEINNIYCLDEEANIIWRSDDISQNHPEIKNHLPYEQMGIKEDKLYASDFYGRNYVINITTGKIEDMGIVK